MLEKKKDYKHSANVINTVNSILLLDIREETFDWDVVSSVEVGVGFINPVDGIAGDVLFEISEADGDGKLQK